MNAHELWGTLDSVGFEGLRLLLSVLWQSSLLLAAITLLSRALRRRPASLKHVLWATALLLAPALPLLGLAASQVGTPKAEIPVMPAYTAPRVASPMPPVEPVLVQNVGTPVAPTGPMPVQMQPQQSRPPFHLLDYPWALGFLAYALGAGAFLALVGAGRLRIATWVRRSRTVDDPRVKGAFEWARKRLALRRRLRVFRSPDVHTPLTVGALRAAVLLPLRLADGLTEAEIRAVAVHELAHVRRRDSLVLTLTSLVRAVLFFHPLVWLACRQASNLAEAACDDAVVDTLGEPASYARMLARLAEELPRRALGTELAAGFLLSKSAFLKRVEAILSPRRDSIRRLTRLTLAGTLLCVALSVGLAMALPVGQRDRGQSPEEAPAADRADSEGARIAGRVCDPEGKPLVDTLIEAYSSSMGPDLQWAVKPSTRTDADGNFALPVPFGNVRYSLSAWKIGHKRVMLNVMPDELGAMHVALQPAWNPGLIHGRVIGAVGEAVADTEVRLVGEYGLRTAARTNERGEFTVGPVGTSIGQAIPLINVDGMVTPIQIVRRSAQNIELELVPAATLTGVVIDQDDGEPVAGATVVVRPVFSSGYRLETTTGEDGAFELTGVPPGKYLATALSPTHFERPPRGRSYELPEVHLWAGQTTDVTIGTERVATVRGRVIDPDGAPVGDAFVAIRSTWLGGESDQYAYVRTDEDGRLAITTGHLDTKLPLVAYRPSQGLGHAEVGPLTSGQTLDDVTIRMPGSVRVWGVVTDAEGRPMPGVACVAERVKRVADVTDAEGRFDMGHLTMTESNRPPYSLTFRAPRPRPDQQGSSSGGFGARNPVVETREAAPQFYQHRVVTYEPTPGGQITLDVALAPTDLLELSGTIVDEDGEPIPDAKVYLFTGDAKPETWQTTLHPSPSRGYMVGHLDTVLARTEADENGRWQFWQARETGVGVSIGWHETDWTSYCIGVETPDDRKRLVRGIAFPEDSLECDVTIPLAADPDAEHPDATIRYGAEKPTLKADRLEIVLDAGALDLAGFEQGVEDLLEGGVQTVSVVLRTSADTPREQFVRVTRVLERINRGLKRQGSKQTIELAIAEVTGEMAPDAPLAGTGQDPVQPGRIEGRLMLGGKPNAGMEVTLVLPTDDPEVWDRRRASADAEGRFVFEDVRPGPVKLHPHVLRNEDGTTTGGLLGLRAELNVVGGETAQVVLGGRGRPVVGRVVVPGDMGAEVDWDRVRVRLWLSAPPFLGGIGSADTGFNAWGRFLASEMGKPYRREGVPVGPGGSFRIEGVPSGTFFIQVNAAAGAVTGDGASDRAHMLSVKFIVHPMPGGESDEPIDLGDRALRPVRREGEGQGGVRFQGRVVDNETGEPIQTFTLQWGWPKPGKPDEFAWGGRTSLLRNRVDGSFNALGGTTPDGKKRWCRVLADGYLPQPLTPAPLTAPEEAWDLEVRLERGMEVRGRVVDHEGEPVAGAGVFLGGPAHVEITDGEAARFTGSQATTDADGRFVLTGAGEGENSVVISAPSLHVWRVRLPAAGQEATIKLPEPATVVLRYDIEGDVAEGEFRLELKTWDMPDWRGVAGSVQEPRVANKGETVLRNVTPGVYDLARTKQLRVGDAGSGAFCDRRTVTLKAGETTEISFVRDAGHPITGEVTGLKEAGVQGAFIYVREEGAPGDPRSRTEWTPVTFDAVTCGADGRFKTARIPPGDYTVVAQAYEPEAFTGVWRTGRRLPRLIGAANVTVPEDGEPPHVRIELKPLPPRPRWMDVQTGKVLWRVDDIVRFDWEKQIFELERERAMDLMMGPLRPGGQFSVQDDEGELYRGYFMSRLMSSSRDAPVIMVDWGLNEAKPPLFEIAGGYASAKEDAGKERFHPRLKTGLEAAGKLAEIDLQDPPPPIETVFTGWHGEEHGLRVGATLFPETFRIGRDARLVLRLGPRRDLDLEPDGFELEATLSSAHGKFFCTVEQEFPATVLQSRTAAFRKPLWGPVFGATEAAAAPGPATLEISLRALKKTQRGTERIGEWRISPQNVTVLPDQTPTESADDVEHEGADAGAAEGLWGEAVEGLRCRWAVAQPHAVVGTKPTVSIEIESISDKPIFWECFSEISLGLSWPGKSILDGTICPKFSVRTGGGVRRAMAREVRQEFGVGKPGVKDSDPLEGYYYVPPGGKLYLSCEVPRKLDKPGEVKIECAVARHSPLTDVKRPFPAAWITCPPLTLDVVQPSEADQSTWGEAVEGASFGPVIERVVSYERGSEGTFIDFETGKLFSRPAKMEAGDSKAWKAWVAERGIDAGGFAHRERGGLSNVAGMVQTARTEWWDSFPRMSRRAFRHRLEVASPLVMTSTGELPATFQFMTREGGMGILQITGFTDDPRGVKIRYKMVQRAAEPEAKTDDAPWGGAVEGVQVRLRADKKLWKAGEVPTFKADLRNNSALELSVQGYEFPHCHLEVDGTWYLGGIGADKRLSPLMPGKSVEGIPVRLAGSRQEVAGFRELRLAAGKHVMRAGFRMRPRGSPDEAPWSLPVSNPVEITILPAQKFSFAPVIERVLAADTGGESTFIDFDTAMVFPLPPDLESANSERIYEWAKEHGVDARIGFDPQGVRAWARERSIDGRIPPIDPEGPHIRFVETWAGHQEGDAALETWRMITADSLRQSEYDGIWGFIRTGMLPDEEAEKQRLRQARNSIEPLNAERLPFIITFTTREGGMGILQIVGFTEDPKGVKIRYKMVQRAAEPEAKTDDAPWGEAVEGVQVRLRADKTVWMFGETPTFKADMRNGGERELQLVLAPEWWEIQLDGLWYRAHVKRTGDIDVLAFDAGQQHNGLEFTVHEWAAWRSKQGDKPLKFEPGKHKVRAAFVAQPADPDKGEPVRAISNPAEITVQRALPGSGLSIQEAVADPNFAFAAACEATSACEQQPARSGVVHGKQRFRILALLVGHAPDAEQFELNYSFLRPGLGFADAGRALNRGKRVIWIVRRATEFAVPYWRGVKALPDTPESRRAVKEAAGALSAAPTAEEQRRAARCAEGLMLQLNYFHDPPQAPPSEVLLLSTGLVSLPGHWGFALIDATQARAISEFLLADGYFRRAEDLTKTIARTPERRAFTLEVSATTEPAPGPRVTLHEEVAWGPRASRLKHASRRLLRR